MYVPGTKNLFGVDDDFLYLLLLFTLVHYTSNWYQVYITLRVPGILQYIITPPPAKICKICILSSVVLFVSLLRKFSKVAVFSRVRTEIYWC